ncbi:MAG: PorT family protein [Bacteroidetes bacterium]|nr:PorT family protein [Bacteroidota bacterium]
MKKILIVFLSILCYSFGYSQVYIQGGVNFANISKDNNGATEKNNTLTTFNVGLLGRFNISDMIDLETGVLLNGQGSKAETYFTNATDDNYVKSKFNPLYIKVPLHAVVRIPLMNKQNVFLYAGPYAAVGIAGKSSVNGKILGVNFNSESNIKFSNDDPFTSKQDDAAYDKIKRFDFGADFGAGIDLGKIIIKANYGLGFTKINSTESNNSANDKNKYRTFSLSLGIPILRR